MQFGCTLTRLSRIDLMGRKESLVSEMKRICLTSRTRKKICDTGLPGNPAEVCNHSFKVLLGDFPPSSPALCSSTDVFYKELLLRIVVDAERSREI